MHCFTSFRSLVPLILTPNGGNHPHQKRNKNFLKKPKQCIPVGCIPPARYRTVVSENPPWTDNPPGQRPRPDRDQLDRDPYPRQRPTLDRDLPVNRIADRCENITFPQLRLRAVTRT